MTKQENVFKIELMFGWIKRNPLASILITVALYLILKTLLGIFSVNSIALKSSGIQLDGYGSLDSALPLSVVERSESISPSRVAPTTREDRLVFQESSMSLVVKNVRQTADEVIAKTKDLGGYMVSSTLNQPEEAPYATIVLRVPAKELNTALDFFRQSAIKVTYENLNGRDVTDEYVDVAARLQTLQKTKVKFEEIMDKAVRTQDILDAQREIINVQSQIDALKGRQDYLEKTAELARVSLNLSTDEFALPYAPKTAFRPEVIFKQAVRSLVETLRGFAKTSIWVAVYGVIWVPILFIVLFLRKRKLKRQELK
ncbi:MAG: DUF4349 domain-containing protein [Patescibacteria group bacterium]